MEPTRNARCVNCRSDIAIPESYAHGDHIKCGTCSTGHKVSRGEVLRVVLADVTPLKDALRDNQRLVERLEDELRGARASFGLGANGLFLGVLYIVVQVALEDRDLSQAMAFEAVGIAVVTGVLLELANHFFLAKRQKIRRLSEEIEEARAEGRQARQRLREAMRG